MTETVQEREIITKEIGTALRHSAVYGVGNVLVKALGFLMLPFYTHYLTPRDYGVLEILDLSMTLLALALNMGLTPAFLRCYAGAESEEEKRTIVSTGCLFGMVTGALMFLLGAQFAGLAAAPLLGPGVPPTYILLSFGSLALSYAANLPRTYLRALDRSVSYTVIDTVNVFLLLVLNIIFIAGLNMGLAGILWSSVIVGGLQFVFISAWAFYKVGFHFYAPHLGRMLGFGLPLIVSNAGLFILNFSDRFFLQHLRSLDVVGVYAVGYKFGFMMNYLFVQPFFVMWQSRMYAIHAQAEHRKIFQEIFGLYSFGLAFCGFAMSLFSREVVHLMVEPKFWASQDVIPIVILSYVFYGLSYYAQLGLFLTDRTRLVGAIGAVAAVLNLLLNYLLILEYGMMGAAAATLLSFLFIAVVSYWCSQRVLRLPLDVGRASLAIGLGIGLYLMCGQRGRGQIAAALAIKLVVLAGFPFLAWKTRILSPSTIATLSSAREQSISGIWTFCETLYRRVLSW